MAMFTGRPTGLFTGLLHHSGLLTPDTAPDAVLAEHRDLLGSFPEIIDSLVVLDRQAAEIDRRLDSEIAATMINTTGAGGLTALAGRSFDQLRMTAVDSPLRDPGDLVGNCARVAAAARELDPDVTVHVGIPYGFGHQDAVATAEAEGLSGLVDLTGLDLTGTAGPADPGSVAEQLGAFVEADLGFAVNLPASGGGPGLLALLTALDALIDDADTDEAAQYLDLDQERGAAAIRDWDETRVGRVRRRLLAVRVPDPAALLDRLRTLELLGG